MTNEETNNEKSVEQPKVAPSPNFVVSAHEAAKKLEQENKKFEENIKKLEELKAFETLGGNSDGAVPQEKPVEISDEDYSKKALEGSI
jgi:hypothetical protein